MARHSVEFKLENPEDAVLLFGSQDKNAQLIESQLAVDINYRGERVQIFADNEEKLVLQRNQMIDDLGIGRDGLLLEIEKMKKIEILNKCNNKNSMILKRENND